MSFRIQLSSATVKALQTRLQHAYQKDDVRLVRRITVLIDALIGFRGLLRRVAL